MIQFALLRLLLLVLALIAISAPPARADDPSFTSNNDILGGRRYLLRKDDLLAIAPYSFRPGNATVLGARGVLGETANSTGRARVP